jgi:hypothetical protein
MLEEGRRHEVVLDRAAVFIYVKPEQHDSNDVIAAI